MEIVDKCFRGLNVYNVVKGFLILDFFNCFVSGDGMFEMSYCRRFV